MKESSEKKLKTSLGLDKGPRRAYVLAAATAALLTLIIWTDFGESLETQVASPLSFKLRQALGFGPKLAPTLKVLAFEDRSAQSSGYTDFSLTDWRRLFGAIAARKPRTILLDKTFSHPLGRDGSADLVRRINATDVPLVAKAHVTSIELKHLEALPLDRYALPQASFIRSEHRPGMTTRRPYWLSPKTYHAYGPIAELLPAFFAIGHNAAVDRGRIAPVINVAGQSSLIHWSLYAGREHAIVDGDLTVDGRKVPLDSEGRIAVNLVSFERALERTRSLVSALDLERRGLPIDWINEGDTVVVLPDMYTGVIDFEDTALGRLPLGFITLALVNSVVTDNWLSVLGGYTPFTILFCLLGAGLTQIWRRRGAFLAVLGGGLAITVIGLSSFVAFGLIVPWLLPALGFMMTASLCFFDQIRAFHQRAALLKHDLDGFLSPEKLEKILDRSGTNRLEATEQVVTIMFIDIVGFSRAAEKQTPKEAFSSLKSLIDALRDAVHEFGGDVDRTMGDGMLCVFGYDLEGAHSAPVHAEHAVQCAAKIQRENIRRILKAQKTGQAVFPLRIGINTTNVYLGNLGDSEKVDFTVIGNGVNFAQRLETACDRHMVMIGASTADLLSAFGSSGEMVRKRHIRVKHHEDLVEAYEVDPFHKEQQLLLDGDEAYRQLIGVERSDTRWPVPYPGAIKVMTNYGDGDLVNFSTDGFTIKLPNYYAKDVAISMRLDTAGGELGERLEQAGLQPIIVEVRWARPAGEGYVHGVQIKNLTPEHRQNIIDMLRDSLHRYVAEARSA